MSDPSRLVADEQSTRGKIVASSGTETDQLVVQLEDGGQVEIDRRRLVPQAEGGYQYQGSFAAVGQAETVEERRIPVARERATVHRETQETGRVRIKKTVREHTEAIDEPIREETVSVERVPIDRVVEDVPAVRTEGNALIIPVVEERLVVVKELVLKEEVHVIREASERRDTHAVTLRSEDVDVERE